MRRLTLGRLFHKNLFAYPLALTIAALLLVAVKTWQNTIPEFARPSYSLKTQNSVLKIQQKLKVFIANITLI